VHTSGIRLAQSAVLPPLERIFGPRTSSVTLFFRLLHRDWQVAGRVLSQGANSSSSPFWGRTIKLGQSVPGRQVSEMTPVTEAPRTASPKPIEARKVARSSKRCVPTRPPVIGRFEDKPILGWNDEDGNGCLIFTAEWHKPVCWAWTSFYAHVILGKAGSSALGNNARLELAPSA
jgi:hypothetical protein